MGFYRSEMLETPITKITFLYLGNNQFTNFTDIYLDQNINPEILRLNNNQFSSLLDLPHYFQYVKELYIEENLLLDEDLTNCSFDQFTNMRLLNLTGTGIKMSPMMFAGAKTLREISLRNNSLTELDVEWFEGLSELKRLDVEENLIEYFDYEDLLTKLPSLEWLRLDNNNFNCSFVEEMVEMLEGLDRLTVLEDPYEVWSKEKVNGKVFGITCDIQTENAGRGVWNNILSIIFVMIIVTQLII